VTTYVFIASKLKVAVNLTKFEYEKKSSSMLDY